MKSAHPLGSLPLSTVYQLTGALAPALIMVAAFPLVDARLDDQSFAIYGFLLTAMSMLSVLDAGLGRAVTYFVARGLANDNRDMAFRSLIAAILLGLLLSVAILVVARIALEPYRGLEFSVDIELGLELLWFLPLFVVGSVLRGYLEAEHRFLAINIVQVLYGVCYAATPIIVSTWTDSVEIYPSLFISIRAAYTGIYAILIWKTCRNVEWDLVGVRSELLSVFRYARWIVISNLVGVAIIFLDRMVIGFSFSPRIVAAYLLPMELLLRGQVLISSLCAVLFPRLVQVNAASSAVLVNITINAQVALAGAFLFCAYLALPFVGQVLALWMGEEFSRLASPVVALGFIGLPLIGCSALAMVVLHARGDTAKPALLHGVELPFYFFGLYFAAQSGSVIAVQIVWLGRLLLDVAGMNLWLVRLRAHGTPVRINQIDRRLTFVVTLAMLWYVALVLALPHLGDGALIGALAAGAVACVWVTRRAFSEIGKIAVDLETGNQRRSENGG